MASVKLIKFIVIYSQCPDSLNAPFLKIFRKESFERQVSAEFLRYALGQLKVDSNFVW